MKNLLAFVIVALGIAIIILAISAIVLAAGWILALVFPVRIAEAAFIVVATAAAVIWIVIKINTSTPSPQEARDSMIEEDAVEAEDVLYTKDGTPICPECGLELTALGPARWTHKETSDEDVTATHPIETRRGGRKAKRR